MKFLGLKEDVELCVVEVGVGDDMLVFDEVEDGGFGGGDGGDVGGFGVEIVGVVVVEDEGFLFVGHFFLRG